MSDQPSLDDTNEWAARIIDEICEEVKKVRKSEEERKRFLAHQKNDNRPAFASASQRIAWPCFDLRLAPDSSNQGDNETAYQEPVSQEPKYDFQFNLDGVSCETQLPNLAGCDSSSQFGSDQEMFNCIPPEGSSDVYHKDNYWPKKVEASQEFYLERDSELNKMIKTESFEMAKYHFKNPTESDIENMINMCASEVSSLSETLLQENVSDFLSVKNNQLSNEVMFCAESDDLKHRDSSEAITCIMGGAKDRIDDIEQNCQKTDAKGEFLDETLSRIFEVHTETIENNQVSGFCFFENSTENLFPPLDENQRLRYELETENPENNQEVSETFSSENYTESLVPPLENYAEDYSTESEGNEILKQLLDPECTGDTALLKIIDEKVTALGFKPKHLRDSVDLEVQEEENSIMDLYMKFFEEEFIKEEYRYRNEANQERLESCERLGNLNSETSLSSLSSSQETQKTITDVKQQVGLVEEKFKFQESTTGISSIDYKKPENTVLCEKNVHKNSEKGNSSGGITAAQCILHLAQPKIQNGPKLHPETCPEENAAANICSDLSEFDDKTFLNQDGNSTRPCEDEIVAQRILRAITIYRNACKVFEDLCVRPVTTFFAKHIDFLIFMFFILIHLMLTIYDTLSSALTALKDKGLSFSSTSEQSDGEDGRKTDGDFTPENVKYVQDKDVINTTLDVSHVEEYQQVSEALEDMPIEEILCPSSLKEFRVADVKMTEDVLVNVILLDECSAENTTFDFDSEVKTSSEGKLKMFSETERSLTSSTDPSLLLNSTEADILDNNRRNVKFASQPAMNDWLLPLSFSTPRSVSDNTRLRGGFRGQMVRDDLNTSSMDVNLSWITTDQSLSHEQLLGGEDTLGVDGGKDRSFDALSDVTKETTSSVSLKGAPFASIVLHEVSTHFPPNSESVLRDDTFRTLPEDAGVPSTDCDDINKSVFDGKSSLEEACGDQRQQVFTETILANPGPRVRDFNSTMLEPFHENIRAIDELDLSRSEELLGPTRRKNSRVSLTRRMSSIFTNWRKKDLIQCVILPRSRKKGSD